MALHANGMMVFVFREEYCRKILEKILKTAN